MQIRNEEISVITCKWYSNLSRKNIICRQTITNVCEGVRKVTEYKN